MTGPQRAAGLAGRYAPPLLLFAFVAALLPGPMLGARPATWDHVVHYAKAWSFLERLPSLDLWSWDWSHYAGYPTEYGYPITAEVLVSAVWLFLGGLVSLSRCYGITIFLVYLFAAGALYWTFSRLIGRTVAALAVFFYLTDFGDFFQGGWFFTLLYGVWPMFLSVALGLLTLERCVALIRNDRPPSRAGLSLLIAVTLLSHPIQLVFLPLTLMALALWAWLDRKEIPSGVRVRLARIAGPAVTLAAALVAFWYLPFLANAPYTLDRGAAGIAPLALLRALVTGHAFAHVVPVAAWAGLLGLGVVAVRGTPRLVGILCVLSLLTMTTLPREVVLAGCGVDLDRKIEFARAAMLAKPLWFAAGAWVLACAARLIHRHTGPRGLAGVGLLAAGVIAWRHDLVDRMPFPAPLIVRTEREVADMRALGDWLDARAREGGGFFRAGHSIVENHDLVELATMTRVPLLKFSYTPGINFRSNLLPITREVAKAVNLRYVISTEPLETDEYLKAARVGPYLVYENKAWDPSPVQMLSGSGAVQSVALGRRSITFDAAPGSSGRALIGAGWFPSWRATRDGTEIPIAPETIDGAAAHTLMSVHLVPGHYELRFRRRPSEIAAFALSAAAWGALAIGGLYRIGSLAGRGFRAPR